MDIGRNTIETDFKVGTFDYEKFKPAKELSIIEYKGKPEEFPAQDQALELQSVKQLVYGIV